MGDTRLLAHVDSLKALDPEVFFIPFLFSCVLVTTWKVGCSNFEFLHYRECGIMTPKVLWVFFFFFLLKIIRLLLHATGQISSFKTKVQQGQETPPPNHLHLSPIQKSFCRHQQDYTDTKLPNLQVNT